MAIAYLEGQVLEEVRGAVRLVRLGPRAGVDPDTDGGGLGPGRVLGGDLGIIEVSSRSIGRVAAMDAPSNHFSAWWSESCRRGCGRRAWPVLSSGRR